LNNHYPFELRPLPYAYDALEPYIDTATMEIHHNKHLKAYVDNLNAALKDYPQYHQMSLEQLIIGCCCLPQAIQTTVKNNAGGVYNHNFYFGIMGYANNSPSSTIQNAIENAFGSYDHFKAALKDAALKRFGSGWAWLAFNSCGKLEIVSTANQDTLLCTRLRPIILIDVWEHAYYLKYQNRRGDYVDNWFNVIDWGKAENNLSLGLSRYE
jgi:Fe-Mn family superoxide dismutase